MLPAGDSSQLHNKKNKIPTNKFNQGDKRSKH